MTGTANPHDAPSEPDPDVPGTSYTELELPESLEVWVASLGLWASVDEQTYRLVSRSFGNGREPEWPFLCSLLMNSGLVTAPTSQTIAFRPEWVPALEHALVALGGADAVRSKLIDAWLETPEPALVVPVVGWASDFARWDALDEIWQALAGQNESPPEAILPIYRDLPPEARRARPMLSWASGSAESLLLGPLAEGGDPTLARLLVDSEILHADWSMREDPDTAVMAGAIRMIGERRLPTTHAGQSIETAWRTKQEIDAFIDSHAREGNGPGPTSQAIFRAFSARLALFLGDFERAVSEARWAALLSEWRPVLALAAGVEALAASLSNDRPLADSTPVLECVDTKVGEHGLTAMARVFEILAEGNDALRRLDRDGVDRVLAAISPEVAGSAGVWAVRVALSAFRSALWGDLVTGLENLSAEISHESVAGREQEEPLGRAMLARARVVLLIKSGAFTAATKASETMSANIRLLPLALIHVWAGNYESAIRLADRGPFEAGLDNADQHQLKLVKAAAALLEGTCDDELLAEGMGELRRTIANGAILPLALMPKPARDALLDPYRSEATSDDGFPVLLERLMMLNDSGLDGIRPVRLTDREIILLPLLAGKDPVPQIARDLHVSVNTVRKQVATLREKFQAETRAELIRKAIAYGAIHPVS